MEIKKSPKADLEKKRVFYTEIGLVATLFILLVAFEWKSYDRKDIEIVGTEGVKIEEEMIIQTSQEAPPPPPPPPAVISTEIEIVDNKTEIKNEVEINAEADEKTEVETYVAPVVEEVEVKEEPIFTIVEENAGFPGGDEARLEYLRTNIRYPVVARESGIQGTVYITFVVEKDGSITDVRILRGIGGGCDEEAVRVVKAMPKWNPGKQRGKAVRVQFSMPIKFTLAG